MNRLNTVLVALGACTGLAVYAAEAGASRQAPQSRKDQCFLASQVNGFSPVSDTIVDVKVGSDRYFRLSLQGSCPDAAFRHRIALRTENGGRWICQGLDAEIVVADPMGGQSCLVRDVQPITKAQWDAGSRH